MKERYSTLWWIFSFLFLLYFFAFHLLKLFQKKKPKSWKARNDLKLFAWPIMLPQSCQHHLFFVTSCDFWWDDATAWLHHYFFFTWRPPCCFIWNVILYIQSCIFFFFFPIWVCGEMKDEKYVRQQIDREWDWLRKVY